jgi:hypothetical protein
MTDHRKRMTDEQRERAAFYRSQITPGDKPIDPAEQNERERIRRLRWLFKKLNTPARGYPFCPAPPTTLAHDARVYARSLAGGHVLLKRRETRRSRVSRKRFPRIAQSGLRMGAWGEAARAKLKRATSGLVPDWETDSGLVTAV